MNRIIDFNNYGKDNSLNITTEDLFNLFLILKQKDDILAHFDINVLMESLAKYKNMERFNSIFKNILVEKNSLNVEIINLNNFIDKKKQEKLIIVDPKNENEIYILGSEEDFEMLSSNYTGSILSDFNNLMFFINNDLEFGINNWELIAEDEIIEVPKYPSVVTGEFIGQDKNNPIVKKKIKKRAIENLKNFYIN